MNKHHNYSLLDFNTFGLNVQTKYFVEFNSTDELKVILSDNHIANEKYLIIGQGSNLLFMNDFSGVVIHSAM